MPSLVTRSSGFRLIRRLALLLLGAALSAGCGSERATPPGDITTGRPVLHDIWQADLDGALSSPDGVRVDGAGNLYVSQGSSQPLLQKFDAAGVAAGRWSPPQVGESYVILGGNEAVPFGVAPDGSSAVAVQGYFRGLGIQVFITLYSPDRRILATLGDSASVPAGFGYALAMDYDAVGRLFVLDVIKRRILVFSGEGQPLHAWGRRTEDPDGFEGPIAIAIDRPRGLVHVADQELGRIVTFTVEGRFVRSWGPIIPAHAPLQRITDLAVEPTGSLLVVDGEAHFLRRFSTQGEDLALIPLLFPENEYNQLNSVAVDGAGRIYVTDSFQKTVRRLTPSGAADGRVGRIVGDRPEDLENAQDLTVDAAGHVFVLNYRWEDIDEFDGQGRAVRAWSPVDPELAEGPTEFDLIARDADGRPVVADLRYRRLYRLEADGGWRLRTRLVFDPAAPENLYYDALRIGPDRSFYLVDRRGGRVDRYGAEGAFERSFAPLGEGPGQFTSLGAVALSPGGEVWILDGTRRRGSRFTPDGRWLEEFSLPPTAGGVGEAAPRDLAFDAFGDALLVDSPASTIFGLNRNGRERWRVILPGVSLDRPRAVLPPGGRLHLMDRYPTRILRFDFVPESGS